MKVSRLVLLFTITVALRAQPSSPPRIAVVGLVHAHVWGHLAEMVKGTSVQLVGVSDPNPALLDEAQKAGVAPALLFGASRGDYRQMLNQTKPDIVWTFVENDRHLEVARECAHRHINVIFEKPLASTWADAKAIAKLARENNIQVMTNYQMAWWPATYAGKAAIDAGRVGQPFRLHGIVGHGGPSSEGVRNQAFFSWLTDPVRNGAGALMDFGCYNLLWSIWYLGMPTEVFATAQHLRPNVFPKVEDNATITLKYPKATALLEGSWNLPRSFQDVELLGPEGMVKTTRAAVEFSGHNRQTENLTINPLPPDERDPLTYMASCVRSGQSVKGLTALDINVQVMQLFELAKQSIATGKAVPVR